MFNPMYALNVLQSFASNPAQTLSSMGMNTGVLQNPQQAVQNLLSSGRMTQEQFNSYRQVAIQLQNMPQFRQIFK